MTLKNLNFGLAITALFTISISNAQDRKKPDLEEMFASYDTNEDKLISLEEFKAYKRKKEVEADVLEKRFAKMDADSNASLTLEEFKAGMEKGNRKGNKRN